MVPSATSGDAEVPPSSTSSTHGSGIGSPLEARTPSTVRSAVQSARNSARISPTSVSCSVATDSAAHSRAADSSASRRGSGKCSTVRTCSTLTPSTSSISRTRIGDRGGVAQLHRELVDGHAVALLQHVDADDVAVDRTDARRDEPERAGPVGEPDPDQDVERAHPMMVRAKMTRVFQRSEDAGAPVHSPCGAPGGSRRHVRSRAHRAHRRRGRDPLCPRPRSRAARGGGRPVAEARQGRGLGARPPHAGGGRGRRCRRRGRVVDRSRARARRR